MALEIREGVLKYTYDLGNGINPIFGYSPDGGRYDDNEDHTVTIHCKHRLTSLLSVFGPLTGDTAS